MTARSVAAFFVGVAMLAGIALYAGADVVFRGLAALRLTGLLLIALLHLPVAALLGWSWWQLSRHVDGATRRRFIWARMVRDAAAEVLPFSQLGGFVLGTRALHLSRVGALSGALSMSVDLVVELLAKVPYFVAGLIVIFALASHGALLRTLLAALALTVALVSAPLLLRRSLRRWIEASAEYLLRDRPQPGSRDQLKTYFDRLFARPRRLLASFLLHTACWFLGAVETWVVFALIGQPVHGWAALAIDSLVAGLRSFGFLIPAAAGVQEASYVVVCALFGVAPATAVAVSLARRARDVALGLPVLAAWQYLEARAAAPRTERSSL